MGVILVSGLLAGRAAAADAPPWRYGFQADHDYGYEVKIAAEFPGETLHFDGTLTYNVLSAAEEQFTWKCSGNLAERAEAKAGQAMSRPTGRMRGPPRGHGGPPRPRFFGPSAQPSRPVGTTLDRRGGLVTEGSFRAAPALLGWLDILVIEPLPAQPKASWDKQTDLRVVEKGQAETPFGHPIPHGETETKRGAVERIDYSVVETKGQVAHVTKKFSLKTAPEAGGVMHIDMTGNGDFDFDLAAGLIKSLSMQYKILVNESNINVTIPVSLKYRLLTDAELAAQKQKAEETANAQAEALKPKPLSAEERSQLIKDLRSRDAARFKAATERLSKAVRDDAAPAVSAALVRAMKGADDWTLAGIVAALTVWAEPEAEPALIEASKSQNFIVRDPALRALGKNFKTKAAAEAVAAQFVVVRQAAAEALKEMGPVAERATIPLLDDRDQFVRGSAQEVLAAIGGKKSLRALEDRAKTCPPHERFSMDRAIAALERRVADMKDDGDSGAEETAGSASSGPNIRTWRDSTGTFQIEATLVGMEGGKVTIKKKDGSQITVPLAKLSEDDQDYVKERNKPKPTNPFQ
jgi:HEAT repeat protein